MIHINMHAYACNILAISRVCVTEFFFAPGQERSSLS